MSVRYLQQTPAVDIVNAPAFQSRRNRQYSYRNNHPRLLTGPSWFGYSLVTFTFNPHRKRFIYMYSTHTTMETTPPPPSIKRIPHASASHCSKQLYITMLSTFIQGLFRSKPSEGSLNKGSLITVQAHENAPMHYPTRSRTLNLGPKHAFQ